MTPQIGIYFHDKDTHGPDMCITTTTKVSMIAKSNHTRAVCPQPDIPQLQRKNFPSPAHLCNREPHSRECEGLPHATLCECGTIIMITIHCAADKYLQLYFLKNVLNPSLSSSAPPRTPSNHLGKLVYLHKLVQGFQTHTKILQLSIRLEQNL